MIILGGIPNKIRFHVALVDTWGILTVSEFTVKFSHLRRFRARDTRRGGLSPRAKQRNSPRAADHSRLAAATGERGAGYRLSAICIGAGDRYQRDLGCR